MLKDIELSVSQEGEHVVRRAHEFRILGKLIREVGVVRGQVISGKWEEAASGSMRGFGGPGVGTGGNGDGPQCRRCGATISGTLVT